MKCTVNETFTDAKKIKQFSPQGQMKYVHRTFKIKIKINFIVSHGEKFALARAASTHIQRYDN